MRNHALKLGWAALIGCLLLLAAGVLAAKEADRLGRWVGTWEGAGSGGSFELTLARGADGTLTGKVEVGQDTGDYSAAFKAVTLEGDRLNARYDFPPDNQAEIVLDGNFNGADVSGTWSLVAPGTNESFAAGSWTVKQ